MKKDMYEQVDKKKFKGEVKRLVIDGLVNSIGAVQMGSHANVLIELGEKQGHKDLATKLRLRAAWQMKLREQGFKMEQAIYLLSNAYVKMKSGNNKNLVLFMGNTGSGKSTLINYLLGCRYVIETKKTSNKTSARLMSGKEVARVGKSMSSMTLYPEVFSKPELSGEFVYCDLAGFFENRGDEIGLCAATSVQFLVRSCAAIKGIVLVLDLPGFEATRAEKFKDAAKILLQIVGGNMNAALNLVSFVITKAEKGVTCEGVLEDHILPILIDLRQEAARRELDSDDQALKELLELMCRHPEKLIISDVSDDGATRDLLDAKLLSNTPQDKNSFNFKLLNESQATFTRALVGFSRDFLSIRKKLKDSLEYLSEMSPKKSTLNKILQKNREAVEKLTQEREELVGEKLRRRDFLDKNPNETRKSRYETEIKIIEADKQSKFRDVAIEKGQELIHQQVGLLEKTNKQIKIATQNVQLCRHSLDTLHSSFGLLYHLSSIFGMQGNVANDFFSEFRASYGGPPASDFLNSLATKVYMQNRVGMFSFNRELHQTQPTTIASGKATRNRRSSLYQPSPFVLAERFSRFSNNQTQGHNQDHSNSTVFSN